MPNASTRDRSFNVLTHHSLTTRILTPLVVAATLAAIGVAWTSWTLGRRWAMEEMTDRYLWIESAIGTSTFPLTPPVLKSLSQLTGTQWITVDEAGEVLSSTLPPATNAAAAQRLAESLGQRLGESQDAGTAVDFPGVGLGDGSRVGPAGSPAQAPVDLVLESTPFFAFAFDRRGAGVGSGRASTIVVLFAKENVDAVAKRAAVLPLLTGLSTIAVVSVLMFLLTSRLIGRLKRLETQVDRIAAGEFESQLSDAEPDEIGRLAKAISAMADQLNVLWDQINRQQGAKLLHQISGGMAHQLRNTLTGAKMAMELHQGKLEQTPDDEVRVALRQLEIAEEYVGRLLALGRGQDSTDQPQRVSACLDDVRSTHQPIADHLRVDLIWSIDASTQTALVKDGASFSAAVSNLVLNAMQAGTTIEVTAAVDQPDRCVVSVTDDGPGVDASVSQTLFDPFVTSKPEGLGLGLPLVKRTAESLGGSIRWLRESEKTTFELAVNVTRESQPNEWS
ncbi:HAMP domain-containing histidine kinase [Stieleria sp. ICT_E10.1]|uniref:sensor histidine kinase n=1 Tax=Stieleria sedimenti TaxID=2976331 RepID=UPI00217F2EDE|nr:HAMP domain-containing histidine kinase [Stieleria sedimenti]MCS7467655.1 HAMP domain-containing histidine kinase [Stieleria sedimenti]